MKNSLRLALLAAFVPAIAFAVYAPIPQQEQGKAFTFRLGASVYHDSNIFGAAETMAGPGNTRVANTIYDSMVYSFTPALSYNGSIDDQTFLSASYKLNIDHFADRPANTNLTNHDLSVRLAHAFSDATNVDVSNDYSVAKNPESLLPGLTLNTDQSYKSNQFNLRFATTLNQKTTATLKYRNLTYAYDLSTLATQLDRMEQIAGVELAFAALPETKYIGEYRYQNIGYDQVGMLKDKRSNFLLAGLDHNAGQNMTLSARAGFEDRKRTGAGDATAPYIELSGRYSYTEKSFLSGGYTYAFEEPSDVLRFTDVKVNRFFVNVQHQVSPLVTASGSLSWSPSQLQGRTGNADIDETNTRLGFALSWLPTNNWTITASLDVDRVKSDDLDREQSRNRFGVSARFSF